MNVRTRASCAGLMAAALAAVSLNAVASQEKGDPALDGKWHVVSLTERGKEVKDEAVHLMTLEFKGNRLTMSMLDKSKDSAVRLDPGKTPREIDLEEAGRPRKLLGIYKVEKDTLTLCFDDKEKVRPTKFESTAEGGQVLLVLKRGEAKVDPKAAEKLREGADRTVSQNNLKQIALAMHAYHDTFKKLPSAATQSKDGKPLLSWRVAILPFIEEQPLYREFKLDEPWDSDHNKKLLARMPKIYAPVRGQPKEPHSTHYQVFTGPGTLFEGNMRITLAGVTDGTSNTVMVVEAAEAVPWTKPADLPYDPKQPLPKLGGMFKDVFNAAFADGSVRALPRQFNADIFRALITRNGREPVDPDKLAP
jgi:uncharacterized protein (TIGR03067 family)